MEKAFKSLQTDSVGPRLITVSKSESQATQDVSQSSGAPWFSEEDLVVIIPIAVQDHHSHPARG